MTLDVDDKRLQNTLKRLGVNTIPGIEEVNLFKVCERALVCCPSSVTKGEVPSVFTTYRTTAQ
eukprot:SAG31_NODE_4144_length_3504_cov_7.703276_2_plen_63_part_00